MNTPADLVARIRGLPLAEGWRDPGTWAELHFAWDGSVFGRAPVARIEDAEAALEFADRGRHDVARMPTHRRAGILREAHARIASEREAVEQLLVWETGKPLRDCRTEVTRALLTLQLSAEEAGRIHGETVPLDLLPGGEGLVGFWRRRPIGTVVGITGFNYPLLLATHKVGPALAAGCPTILKPSPKTPLSALYLADVLREAGAPPAAVQAVTGDVEVGELLVRDRRTAAVSFTGSAAVGYAIARAAAGKKVILELGSNAALVVADDADLEAAARACVRGGYYASGQACISVQRVIVQEAVLPEFADRLRPLVASIRTGDPRDEATEVGPLIDEQSARRVEGWVLDAVAAGASATGGERTGTVVRPALLSGVPEAASAWREEIFGPVLCLAPARSFDEALEMVNRSAYGLHVSVFTRSLDRAFAAADRIDAGGVLVNEIPGFRADNMPYGGVKLSGFGREGPRFAIEELTTTQVVAIRPRP